MNIKHLFTIAAGIAFLHLASDNVLAETTNSPHVALSIKLIKVFPSHSEFSLVLTNNTGKTINISRFELANVVLSAVNLKTDTGQQWSVARPAAVEDPPPAQIDFSLWLPVRGSTNLTIGSRRLERVSKSLRTDPVEKPIRFAYEVSRELGFIDGSSGKFHRAICNGKGQTQVEWVIGSGNQQ